MTGTESLDSAPSRRHIPPMPILRPDQTLQTTAEATSAPLLTLYLALVDAGEGVQRDAHVVRLALAIALKHGKGAAEGDMLASLDDMVARFRVTAGDYDGTHTKSPPNISAEQTWNERSKSLENKGDTARGG